MDASEYQKLAARTLISKPDFELTNKETMLLWQVIGLTGEAGEVAENIKKGVLHRHGLDESKLLKELGDVMWYTAALVTILGGDLSDIMETNIAKLRERYPNGYSSEDSIKRVDTK